jgi:phosphocarrier protein
MTIEKKITIRNKLGLHARPAALFVQIANKFDCDITVKKGKQEVNGKSIMGIMMLAAGKGDTIHIKAQGEGCERAIRELDQLLMGDLDKTDSVL